MRRRRGEREDGEAYSGIGRASKGSTRFEPCELRLA